MREQEVTAQRCAELGLGVAPDPRGLTAEALRAAVDQVRHTPTSREQVRAMQRAIHEAGGYRRAVKVIASQINRVQAAYGVIRPGHS